MKDWHGTEWRKDLYAWHVCTPALTSVTFFSVEIWYLVICWQTMFMETKCILSPDTVHCLPCLKACNVVHITFFLRGATPLNLVLILHSHVYMFVWSQPDICLRLTTHCSVCVCLSVAGMLGRTKQHLSMSRIIIISMVTASSTSCSLSLLLCPSVCG